MLLLGQWNFIHTKGVGWGGGVVGGGGGGGELWVQVNTVCQGISYLFTKTYMMGILYVNKKE